jgi:hypothetical protein
MRGRIAREFLYEAISYQLSAISYQLSAISYQRNRATFHVLVADGCSSTLSEEQMHGTPGAFPDPAAAPISLSSRRR